MKYQPQNDLIDPDVPLPDSEFDYDGSENPNTPSDAYVIGEGGSSGPPPIIVTTGTRYASKWWVKPAAFALFAAFIALTTWNLSRVVKGPGAPPVPTPFELKQALYLGVMKIDAFRRVHGATPNTLTEAGLPDDGTYMYKRLDADHYTLSFRAHGPQFEYNSRDSKDTYFGSPQLILSMGEKK
jgi:hypothetical protein